ncbi:MAG TPA: polysaccharide deacetylase family protein [Methylomirabilota bacterium]|nr:polysaccharide deacetylase family protein [Methylomirabilota bacterium]
MKNKLHKRSQKPRYITIRIQYYPLNTKLIIFPLVLLILIICVSGSNYIFNNWQPVPVYATSPALISKTPFKTAFPFLQATTSSTLAYGEDTVPADIDKNNDIIVFHGSRDKKNIALTFDADMTEGMKNMLQSGVVKSYYDKRITDYLTATHTEATLFLTGMWIELYPQDAKELATNPLFALGNHSYSHPSFSGVCYGLKQISDSQKQEQVEKTQQLLKNLTGVDNTLFRFPGGCYGQSDLQTTKNAGLTVIQWDVAGEDGFNDNVVSVENNVINNVKNGSIIVLHMSGYPNAPRTLDALSTIIDTLKQRGFTFVKVSDLFAQPTPTQPQDLEQNLSL